VGKEHIDMSLDFIRRAKSGKIGNGLIVGFDLVCEEDRFRPMVDYLAELLKAKEDH
jgi:hypothetical protein